MPKSAAAACLLFLAAILVPPALRAADIGVETLEMVSHGGFNDDTDRFEVGTRLFYNVAIKGGDKFSGLLRLDFNNSSIEDALSLGGQRATNTNAVDKLNALTSPRLRTAAITAREAFTLPLNATYFVGYLDAFCSGDDFGPLFGAAPFGTKLRGPMVYPDGVASNPDLFYDGIAAANGTGFRLGTTPKFSDNLVGYFYFYQDADLGPGYWTGNARFLLNGKSVKFEVFGGASTGPDLGEYRGGLLFFAAPGEVGEFFAQVGITKWDPATSLSANSVFFLIEPRVNFGAGSLALTVFYHPETYREQPTSEKQALDMAVNLRFGKLEQSGMQGGIEGVFKSRPLTTTQLSIDVSPYYGMISGGVEWDFKLGLRLFPFPSQWYGVLQPFIGLKTSF